MDILNISELILLSSLIASVIVILILIIKAIFRNKISSTFHYYIWLILIFKLIVPIGPQTPLSVSNIYKNFSMQSSTNEATQLNSSKQLNNSNLDVATSKIALSQPNSNTNKSAMNFPLKIKVNIEKVFSLIWILGIVVLSGILIKGHKKLKDIVRTSTKNINSIHKEILCDCMKAINTKTEVDLLYSEKISSPSLCGLIKPKILIPVSVAANVSDEEFSYIIMHELTHLKNKDIFINWVITLLSIIYWFNPILIYAFHKMRLDREIYCDSKSISYLDDGQSVQYGNAIIRVLELSGNINRLMGTTSMVMNSSEIKRRIIMISKYKKSTVKGILLGTIIVVIIGGLAIALNTSKLQADSPVSIAEQFVENIYTVDANKVTEFKTLLATPAGNVIGEGVENGVVAEPNEKYIKITQSLDKNIQPLMTKEAYEAITANTFNLSTTKICADGNYTAQVTAFTLGKNVYGKNEDKVRYPYEIKVNFISSNGKSKQENVSKGAIELLKQNGQWKVSLYDITQFSELYK